jgi:hypothetical protein
MDNMINNHSSSSSRSSSGNSNSSSSSTRSSSGNSNSSNSNSSSSNNHNSNHNNNNTTTLNTNTTSNNNTFQKKTSHDNYIDTTNTNTNNININDNDIHSIIGIDTPTFDIKTLEIQGEELATKAAKKIRKATAFPERLGLLSWIRKWRKKGSLHKISSMFDDLIPRLNGTKDDIIQWLEAISEKKEQAIEQGDMRISDMNEYIDHQNAIIDSIDELINDCLTINYDLTREMADINAISIFNSEIVSLKSKSDKNISQRDNKNDSFKIKLNPAVWQGFKNHDDSKLKSKTKVSKEIKGSIYDNNDTNSMSTTTTNRNNNNDTNDNNNKDDDDDEIISVSLKPSVSVRSLKLMQPSTSSTISSSPTSSPTSSPPCSVTLTSNIPSPPLSLPIVSVTSRKSFNTESIQSSGCRKKSISNAHDLNDFTLLAEDTDQQDIQAKYSKCQAMKDDVNLCLVNLRNLRDSETQALKRAKKIKEELRDICDIAKESPSKKEKVEPSIYLNATSLMLPNYRNVSGKTDNSNTQASESCPSASSGSVISSFDANYIVSDCLDDIKILIHEEERAKGQLSTVIGILAKTEDIMIQLQSTLDKDFSLQTRLRDSNLP